MSARRPLRLLVYSDSREVGGAEIALSYLLGALDPEIAVGVLALDPAVADALAQRRQQARIRILEHAGERSSRAALLAHMRAIRAFSPDILHLNKAWPWACGYAELAGTLTAGVAVVAVDHLPIDSGIPRRRRLARRLLASRIDAHVAVGERVARRIEQLVGLRRASVRAIPNGVPPLDMEPAVQRNLAATVPPVSVSSLEGASAPASGLAIGSLGRITEQKGYDLLVRVLPELPQATLTLVGDGPQRAALETLARQLGVADRLRVTGWTRHAQRLLVAFDVFALPSRWEGMPLVILEAMHAGLPVVASDVGSVAEAVLDGDTGFVVPTGDTGVLRDRLARLLADASLRRGMGERARALARSRFTAEVMAGHYEEVYRELLAGRTREKRSSAVS